MKQLFTVILLGIVLGGCYKRPLTDQQAMEVYNKGKRAELAQQIQQQKARKQVLLQVVKIGESLYVVEGVDTFKCENTGVQKVSCYGLWFDNDGTVTKSVSRNGYENTYSISEKRPLVYRKF